MQFAYAAATSRLVDDVGFGAYAVALSVSALITLLANGGLGQTVSRMKVLEPPRTSALAVYALLMGLAGATTLLATADLAAQLWATPEAAEPIRVLAVAALFGPLTGLLAGVLRRQQRFRALAVVVVVTNATGMVVGVVAVILAPSPAALVVSPTSAAVALVIALTWLTRRDVLAPPRLGAIKAELGFSWNVTALSVISYLNANLGKLAIARGVGADVLGQWNRADVVTTVPLEQAHRALQQAIYPEYRHDIGSNARTRELWTDLLLLVAWASFPSATVVGLLVPTAIPILFGPGWDLSAHLAFPLAAIMATQVVSTTLGAALEAVGRFRWILATHLVSLSIHMIGGVAAVALGQWWPVFVALGASRVVQHFVQVSLLAANGGLNVRRLWTGYLQALAFSTTLGVVVWCIRVAVEGDADAWLGLSSALILIIGGTVAFRHRKRLPPIKILDKYL